KKKILVGIIVFLIAVVCIVSYVVVKKATTEGIWLGDYKYIFDLEEKTAYIRDYRGNETEITFPTEIIGFKITYVRISSTKFDDAQSDTDGIKVINVPKGIGVIYIGYASSLEEIYFEDGTTEIKGIDLEYCTNLKLIEIPEMVEDISIKLTHGEKLENIHFPRGAKYVEGLLGSDTLFVKNHINDKYYVVGNEILLLYNGDEEEIVVPAGIKVIPEGAFYTNKLKELYIPDTVKMADTLALVIPKEATVYFGNGKIENLEDEMDCFIHGTVVAPAGSYMEQYCKENNVDFRVMTEEEEAIWREKTEAAASEITYQE
uniref:leucine-rich repeat protein n=1 Tax=Pseudobutyrivibrio sp. TaxID=2014367 RepID=UPI00386F6DF7